MKKLIYLGLFVFIGLGMSSCKECTICQIKAGDFYESAEDEFCGSPSEVDEFEDDYEKRAQALGISTARAYCIRQ